MYRSKYETAIATDADAPRAALRPAFGRWIAFGLVIAFLALVGWKLLLTTLGQVKSGAAPDFTLNSFDGGTLRLADLRGQVVMVDFWASWCVPCQQEARMLEAVWREYRNRGVMFIGVDYLDPESDARAFLDKYQITYPNGPDLGTRISQAYRIQGVPEKFFIDKRGYIRALKIGPVPMEELRQQLEVLLAEP